MPPLKRPGQPCPGTARPGLAGRSRAVEGRELRTQSSGSSALWSALLAGLLASCASREARSGPLLLAANFVPEATAFERAFAGAPGQLRASPARGAEDPASVWIEAPVSRAAWSDAGAGFWSAPMPFANESWGYGNALPTRLWAADEAFEAFDPERSGTDPSRVPAGSFGWFQSNLYLRLAAGREPPEECRFARLLPRGRSDSEGSWRIELGRFSAAGWPLVPGLEEGVEVPLDRPQLLHFKSASIALHGRYPIPPPDPLLFDRSSGDGEDRGTIDFEVRLDGKLLARFVEPVFTEGHATRREVTLPVRRGQPGRLSIQACNGAAWCAALEPRITPVETARSSRPNLLIVLADTFRADNLAVLGGQFELTPNLDRWAGRALVFPQAWSPAGWTLPSQASLMTSLWPLQHGALTATQAIPGAALTLAEALRAEGYRTGAVTDGGLVSRVHNFEQGFEWFDERFRPLEDLLAASEDYLAGEDGRPWMLYLHTYRTHHPYYASPETLERHGTRLGVTLGYAESRQALRDHPADWWNHKGPIPEDIRPTIQAMQSLYRAGVIDLDQELGRYLDRLEARGAFAPGVLVFTSDHGEAFGEHDNLQHEGGAYEEQSRIPLFFFGAGVAAGQNQVPASLIDVAPTALSLLGLPAPKGWKGAVLPGFSTTRTLLCVAGGPQLDRPIALLHGTDKLLVPELDPKVENLQAAFDLSSDPGERVNLLPERTRWAQDTFLELRPDLERFSLGKLSPGSATAGGAEQVLQALGYLEKPKTPKPTPPKSD